MSTAAILQMTEAEYLAAERVATERHEYLAGECWTMSGGTGAHLDEVYLKVFPAPAPPA